MSVKRTPQRAVPYGNSSRSVGEESWWYEGSNSITVHIETKQGVSSCKINRRYLADWIKRTEPKR